MKKTNRFQVHSIGLLKRLFLKTSLSSLLFLLSSSLVFSQDLIKEDFSVTNSNWQPVTVCGSGNYSFTNGQMVVTANSASTYGVYNTKLLSGHFYAEVDLTVDNNVGLALFKANGSVPDINNYTMITIQNVGGKVVASVSDKQNGVSNVLDCTNKVTNKSVRYSNTLDASTYSIPWVGTNKRLRILRHANEKFIHYYYQVKKNIHGKDGIGWAELSPSPEWTQLTGNYYLGLVAINGQATFDNANAWSKPLEDKDDTNTGFAATWREMNWSGYFGNALVVTFDKTKAPLTGGSRKFVFWTEFNNVPAWYLDKNLMYTYEFVETWGGGNLGCHEPMSDRILRYSSVNLDVNTDTLKVIHWQYILNNPDYKIPDDLIGTQMPTADEYYYIYPDGTIIRKIQYRPKLDTSFRSWHELFELIVVAGNNTKPSDHTSNPALSIWPIHSIEEQYEPHGKSRYNESKNDATICATHFENHPDVFNVFNDNCAHPETYGGNPINIYKTWHSIDFGFTHWPVSKEQYWADVNSNSITWPQQINHSSLCGGGVYGGTDWNSNYKTDANGRKYREWLSLLSLSTKGNIQEAKTKTLKWLTSPFVWQP